MESYWTQEGPPWARVSSVVFQRCDCVPRDIWQGPETFWVITTGGGATGIWWGEPKDAAPHRIAHRATPAAENYPAPRVSSAGVGNPQIC